MSLIGGTFETRPDVRCTAAFEEVQTLGNIASEPKFDPTRTWAGLCNKLCCQPVRAATMPSP